MTVQDVEWLLIQNGFSLSKFKGLFTIILYWLYALFH